MLGRGCDVLLCMRPATGEELAASLQRPAIGDSSKSWQIREVSQLAEAADLCHGSDAGSLCVSVFGNRKTKEKKKGHIYSAMCKHCSNCSC